MILKDYKFDPRVKTTNSKSSKRGRLIIVAAMVLGASVLVARYVDIKPSIPSSGSAEEQALALPLPDSNETESSAAANTPARKHETPVTVIPASEDISSQEETLSEDSATPGQSEIELKVVEHKIRSGESLAKIFAEKDLSPNLLHRIVTSSKTAANLSKIKPGEVLRFETDHNDELIKLTLQRDRVSSLRITANDQGFDAIENNEQLDTKVTEKVGVIQSSLFVDGQKAGLSDAQIMEMAGLFGWDIDFALELRVGDRFSVIFEERYLDGEKYENGPILAAEFINQGNKYRAIRYQDSNGNIGYFDESGHPKKRAFIRTPLKFARVSSGFTTKRWHPVLKKWRSHKGTDYAAKTGTPVKATGNGKVTFRGKKGGYGNVVFIQHGGTYTTVYAHLSKFSKKARKGKKVKQGDIIGYVGSTGLASGPHLHYEFRVNGVHRNPLTVKLPKSVPLPKTELTVFKLNSKEILAQLDRLSSTSMVASATP
ncbi:MAG: OapA family protein [bacterium]